MFTTNNNQSINQVLGYDDGRAAAGSESIQRVPADIPFPGAPAEPATEQSVEHLTTELQESPAVFRVTGAFIGKKRELEVMHEALEQAAAGSCRVVLIQGESGTGKTRLVRRFLEQAGGRGLTARGKFQPLDGKIPYKVVSGALQRVLTIVTGRSPETFARWRDMINENLGGSSAVVAGILPDLKELLGEQTEKVSKVTLPESQELFLYAFSRLIQMLARENPPLLFFLDDLQWADPASLKLLEAVTVENRVKHMLFIGVYREDEAVHNSHFMEFIHRIKWKQPGVRVLKLEPATLEEVSALVAATLNCNTKTAEPLAQFVRRRTGGNLLFVKELLEFMYISGLIVRDTGRPGGWRWDLKRARKTVFAGDLVRFLLEKLERLPAPARRTIQLAACAGGVFHSELLAAISEEPVEAVERHLELCVREGLLEKKGNRLYCFVHDRVQQAAYLSLAAGERRSVHFQLGRLMLGSPAGQLNVKDLSNLFDAVNHVNLGLPLPKKYGMSFKGAVLNLLAAQKARRALAFNSALEYLRAGLSLLEAGDWVARYPLAFRLHLELLECEQLCGHNAAAEKLYAQLLGKAANERDRTRVYLARVLFFARRRIYSEAVDTGLRGLRELGFALPLRPSGPHLIRALLNIKLLLHKRGMEQVSDLPPVTKPEIRAAMDLLVVAGDVAYQYDRNLMSLLILKLCELSLRHGNSKNSGSGYMSLAMFYLHSLKDYGAAVTLAAAALELAERGGSAMDKYVVNFLYGAFVLPWVDHVQTSERYLSRALEYSLAASNIVYAGYAMALDILSRYTRGAPLAEILDKINDYGRFEGLLQDSYFPYYLSIIRQFARALRGMTNAPVDFSDREFDEKIFYRKISTSPELERELFDYCLCKAQLSYMWGDHHQALSWLGKADRLAGLFYGEVYLADHAFYYCLTILALFQRLDAGGKATRMARLHLKKRRLKMWSRHCPANFEHKYLLVSAELARVRRNNSKAAVLYDRAIRSASEHGYTHCAAIACECAAVFYLGRGMEAPARGYLRAARDHYRAWGAAAKVEQLHSRYPWLNEPGEGDISGQALKLVAPGLEVPGEVDMDAIFRAAQAISGEILLEKLLPEILKTALRNAGAEWGCLVLHSDDVLRLEAVAEAGPDGIAAELLPSVPLEKSGLLPSSVIKHTIETGDILVLRDVARIEKYRYDTCLTNRGPVSVLCLPVVGQGRLFGLLYLESETTTGCFRPGQIETLKLLSSQFAVSLQNALLYRNMQQLNMILEDRVRERTASLARMQKEAMEALLEQSRLEERNRIAGEIHHTVGNVLTSVLTQIEAGKRLLGKNSALAAAKLEQSQEILRKGLDEIRSSIKLLRRKG